jgi:hypothetical protein
MTPNRSTILIHYRPFFPRRIYIEAPEFSDVEDLMNVAGLESLLKRHVNLSNEDRQFLYSSSCPEVPAVNTFVRITHPGLYHEDVGIVIEVLAGDLITIALVPRSAFPIYGADGKTEVYRSTQALLDPDALLELPCNQHGVFERGRRRFHATGLELLVAPCAHGMKHDPNPSEEECALLRPALQLTPPSNVTIENRPLLRREEKQIGKWAAIIGGHHKGWRGELFQINHKSAIIQAGGRYPPFMTVPLRHVVLV